MKILGSCFDLFHASNALTDVVDKNDKYVEYVYKSKALNQENLPNFCEGGCEC